MNATGRDLSLGLFVLSVACGVGTPQSTTDWPVYNGTLDGDHYSRLAQINRTNVHRLKVAWSFDTGEEGVIEFNPLIVGRVLLRIHAIAEGGRAGRRYGEAQVEVRLGRSGHATSARSCLLERWSAGANLCRSDALSLRPRRRHRKADPVIWRRWAHRFAEGP